MNNRGSIEQPTDLNSNHAVHVFDFYDPSEKKTLAEVMEPFHPVRQTPAIDWTGQGRTVG